MLPTSGYFKNLICPYFEKDKCDRIYCHFKHKKPIAITYTPTPVHLLQKQPTEFSSSSCTPEYKPTPIDKLKSTSDSKGSISSRPIDSKTEKNGNRQIGREENNSNKQQLADNATDKSTNSKKKDGKPTEAVYENIESTLSSIFDEDTDDEISIVEYDKEANSSTKKSEKETYKKLKKDDCSYIEELDKITKDTKAKRGLQDKEIENKAKLKQKKNAPLISETEQVSNPISKKARIAHKTGDDVNPTLNAQLLRKNTRMTPAQAMFNRFAALQNSDQVKQDVGTKTDSSSTANKKRIAHMPSANKTSTSDAANKQLPKRPILPLELGGKVPNTIRQRYLNLIIDECLKVIQEHEEAYRKALDEEKTIFKRSPSKNTYVNLAVNTIKRIRDSGKSKGS